MEEKIKQWMFLSWRYGQIGLVECYEQTLEDARKEFEEFYKERREYILKDIIKLKNLHSL